MDRHLKMKGLGERISNENRIVPRMSSHIGSWHFLRRFFRIISTEFRERKICKICRCTPTRALSFSIAVAFVGVKILCLPRPLHLGQLKNGILASLINGSIISERYRNERNISCVHPTQPCSLSPAIAWNFTCTFYHCRRHRPVSGVNTFLGNTFLGKRLENECWMKIVFISRIVACNCR